tara:strand:+ start:764 stop:1750 length:987 start_codon:yes stop_codon:yes gene_type:complete
MKSNWQKKALPLFIKIALLVLSIWFLYRKIDLDSFEGIFDHIPENLAVLIFSFFGLWLLNLYFDALFWKKVHGMIEKVRLLRALKINLICYSLNFITPAQGGDLAVRYVMMSEASHRKKSFFLNLWMYLPKFFARFLIGGFALGILLPYLNLMEFGPAVGLSLIFSSLLFFAYFSLKKLQRKLHFKNIRSFKLEHYLLDGRPTNIEKARFLLIAILRFLTFNAQFALILFLFSDGDLPSHIWLAIPVYYFVSALLPSFAFADFILKSAIAVWIFEPITSNEGLLVATSLSLWFANVALPSFLGLYFILKTDLYQSIKLKFSRKSPNEI